MVAGRNDSANGAEYHQCLEEGQAAAPGHRRGDEGEHGDEQQRITLQDAQRAWCLAQDYLHVEGATDQRKADQAQQYQKAPFPIQARCLFVHCRFLRWIVAAWSACLGASLHAGHGL
ncbi:hypothetical protein D3C71_1540570 [compost metagenome]